MFLVTTFMGGQMLESLATRHDLHSRLDWCEDDYPILEAESIATRQGVVAVTIVIRRATPEEIERLS